MIFLPKNFPPAWEGGAMGSLLLDGRGCEKFGIYPLTPPSPTRGEGEHIEIKKFPPP